MEVSAGLVDIVLLGVLVLGAYEGYRKGFFLGLLGLVGLLVALILGFYLMEPAAVWLEENINSVHVGYPLLGFFLVFIISISLINLLGWLLKKVMDMTILGTFDRFGGIIFGLIKAGFFISLLLWLVGQFDIKIPAEWSENSELLAYVEPMAPTVIEWLEPYFPSIEHTKETLKNVMDELLNRTNESESP